jgi:hypothetical protein
LVAGFALKNEDLRPTSSCACSCSADMLGTAIGGNRGPFLTAIGMAGAARGIPLAGADITAAMDAFIRVETGRSVLDAAASSSKLVACSIRTLTEEDVSGTGPQKRHESLTTPT